MHAISDGINSFLDHPMVTDEPREILKFAGNNLRKPQKRTQAKIDKGKRFEEEVTKTLEEAFPDATVLSDMYFLTGNYYDNVKLYGSVQIDNTLITSRCMYIIECKSIASDVDRIEIKSGTERWRLILNNGRSKYEVNGGTQNRWHENYLFELMYFRNIRVPIKRITVLGGISPNKVYIGPGCKRDNIVVFDQLVDTIKAFEMELRESIDSAEIINELLSFEWRNPERELLHYIFITKKKKGLPRSCNGYTENFH